MTFSQRELHLFTRKLYRFLKSEHYMEFKKLKQYRGFILQHETPHVVLDHRDRVISTLIHEVLHHLHPDACETKVLEMERGYMNQLSDRQIRNIFKRFAEVL